MITSRVVISLATNQDVLKVARSQIGVKESPAGSNKQKYGKEFGLNGVAWCAEFCWWCFKHAGCGNLFPHNANAAYAQDQVVSKCGGKWIMKKNTSRSTRQWYLGQAQPGDIVCFDFGKMNAYRQHIGIVESVSGNNLICIEGNTSVSGSQSNGGMVCRKTRYYTQVCSAARPAYSGYVPPEPKPTPDPYAQIAVDGDFGPATKRKMQCWLGVNQDGIVGKATVKALQNKVGTKADGAWGPNTTKALQRYLGKNGHKVQVDGQFGRKTIMALQRYLNETVKK